MGNALAAIKKNLGKLFGNTSKEEYSNKAITDKALALQKEIAAWQGNIFHEKISMGENCNSSWYIKESGNKNASYPYDWIFSSPEIVLHTLKDEFNMYLDKSLMEPDGYKAGHKFYHDSIYNHRNPLQSDKDYEYYVRCVERLQEQLNKKIPVVFVCTVINEHDKRPAWKNGFNKSIPLPAKRTIDSYTELIDYISSINPNCKFFFIEQYTEGEPSLEKKINNEKVFWIRFTSFGKNDGVKYLNGFDDGIIKTIYSGLTQEKNK